MAFSCTKLMPLFAAGTSSNSGFASAPRKGAARGAIAASRSKSRRVGRPTRLYGIRIAGFRNPDPVIGEAEVNSGKLGLRHMAGRAVLLRSRTLLPRGMAGHALRIVERNIAHGCAVRVV